MKSILKIISFLIGCFIILLIAVASNSEWFDKATNYFPSPFRYGDLYRTSNASEYRFKKSDKKFPNPCPSKDRNLTLTIIGDSYSQGTDTSYYYAGGGFQHLHWNQIPHTIYPLDTSKRNVIILECSERFARYYMRVNKFIVPGKTFQLAEPPKINLLCENPLQYMFTNFDCVLPFKELKTNIYLNWFDKFDSITDRPDGSGRLFMRETVDPKLISSSFTKISNADIDTIVDNLNLVQNELKAIGFDEVYVSIIPNSASIYKTMNVPYNHIIERIENSPRLSMRTIDIYKKLKEEKHSVFYLNDTHWNTLGKVLWLIEVNKKLRKKN